ncbi:MAG: signal peptidase II [Oscillospiraceae bacterium]|nr:signal peptidase II [Oscillospiraceae bacterium]
MFYVLLLLICGGCVALDQITKLLTLANIPLGGYVEAIPGLFHFTYLQNTGAAFSILQGQRTFFLILTALFLAGMIFCLVKKIFPKPYFWFLAVITGGAIGNLIDRMRFAFVVDMIEVEFINFPVFNVADIFITCGAVLLVVYALFFDKSDKKENTDDGTV